MLEMQPLMRVSFWRSEFASTAVIQESGCEHGRDAYFPSGGHVQAPDFDDGQE